MTDTVIHLTDNCRNGRLLTGKAARALLQLTHLGPLKEHPELLVFPHSLDDSADGIGELPIVTAEQCRFSPQGACLSLKACTGNAMGFVGTGGISFSIHSRFSRQGKDFFLLYMLQKVLSVNVVNLEHASAQENPTMDLLLCLFPHFLKKALSQGLFKAYRNFHHHDDRARGCIDTARYIRQDVPFQGKVSYRTREHSFDNPTTQLVRHTIECIKCHPLGNVLLNGDPLTKDAVAQIVQATPSYETRHRRKVIEANLRPSTHPYFLHYGPLQKLCLRILRHDSIQYGEGEQTVYGLLFDGSWLWEEYVNTILRKKGFNHPNNRKSCEGVQMFALPSVEEAFDKNRRTIYPDFYSKEWIIDAKYKRLNGHPGREDLYQVVTYMYCMNKPFGGYVYPDDANHEARRYKLAGVGLSFEGCSGGILEVIPFHVPQDVPDWPTFVQAMQQEEKNLSERFS